MPSASPNYIYNIVHTQYTYLRVHMTRFAMNLYRSRTSPPGGSSCAIFRQTGVLGGGGIGGARVRSRVRLVVQSVVHAVCAGPTPLRRARLACFPSKKLIISPRIQSRRGITYPAIIY